MNFWPRVRKALLVDLIFGEKFTSYGYLRRGFECRPEVEWDESGIPKMDYTKYPYASEIGSQYNLTSVCQYGLENIYNYWNVGDARSLENFSAVLRFMLQRRLKDARGIRWQFDYDYLDVKSPWVSAQVSGLMLSLLVNAYRIFDDENYLCLAREVVIFYNEDVSRDGFSSSYDMSVIFQQYTNCEEWRRFGLNGFLTALLGLSDYFNASSDGDYIGLLESGIDTLLKCHRQFQTAFFWTSLYPVRLAGVSRSLDYHVYHYELMYCLANITQRVDLYAIYLRWALLPPRLARRVAQVGSSLTNICRRALS